MSQRHHFWSTSLFSPLNYLIILTILLRHTHSNMLLSGLILGLRPASGRKCHFVMTSLNGWVQSKNQPWLCIWLQHKKPFHIHCLTSIFSSSCDNSSGSSFNFSAPIRSQFCKWHYSWAELSWHVQNFDMIGLSFFVQEQNTCMQDFDYEPIKTVCEMARYTTRQLAMPIDFI